MNNAKIPKKPLDDLYQDSIIRTEQACANYLKDRDFTVQTQPLETRSARIAKGKKEGYKQPDIDVYHDGYLVQIEVKAYMPFTPFEIFSTEGKCGYIKHLKGWGRFNQAQRMGFSQGLDEYEVKRLLKWQNIYFRVPIIIGFNDFDLSTYNGGKGLWYGARLGEFVEKGRRVFYKKSQYYLKISNMKPLDQVVREAISSSNIGMFLTKMEV